MTTNPSLLKDYEKHDAPNAQPTLDIEQVPQVTRIKPIPKLTKKQIEQQEEEEGIDANHLTEDYYLKRHRRHEKEEKTQKNREKERLRHGYYQQKQLVERIKTMDKSLLQSIVTSIRHRTHYEEGKAEEEEEEYLNDLHCRLLNDAVEHLRRYEVLGLSNERQENSIEQDSSKVNIIDSISSPNIIISNNNHHHNSINNNNSKSKINSSSNHNNSINNIKFKEALKSEAKKQRERQIKSFSNQPMFAGDSLHNNRRRSNRHVIAFGQKLPEFNEIDEFRLPTDIINWNKKRHGK